MSRPAKLLISVPSFGWLLSNHSGEQHGDALVVGDATRVAQGEQAGEARAARSGRRAPRSSSSASAFASTSVASSTTSGAPPVLSISSTTDEPVVGLVVEDAVRDAVRLALPRPHELRAMVRRLGDGPADLRGAAVGAGRGDRVERAPERPGALGLHRVEPGWRGDRTERGRLAERRGARARERAAADLDDQVVDGRAGRGELGGDLVAERLSALDGEPVQVALAGEGNRARLDRLEEPVHGRVAGLARRSRAGGDDRAELLEPREHGRLGIDRDEDAQRALAGGGDDGGREGGVAAARDREVGPLRRDR